MPHAKLYVGNLSFDLEAANLITDFSEDIGEVIEAVVIKHRNGKSKGFGFIHVKEEDIDKFLDYNGCEYAGRKLVIKKAIKKERKEIKRHEPQPPESGGEEVEGEREGEAGDGSET